MFTLAPLPPPIDPTAIALLLRAEPATIGHFLDMGFMDPGIRLLTNEVRIAGTAITVRAPGTDCIIIHYALGQARPGDVLVIDRCGDMRHAGFGGAVAYAARAAGIAGVVMDGLATDLQELRRYGVPVWARGLTAITNRRHGMGGDLCTPIACGGVGVEAGDAIFADENGVLVLKPQLIEECATRAIGLQEEEKAMLARIDAGERLPDLSGATAMVEAALARRT